MGAFNPIPTIVAIAGLAIEVCKILFEDDKKA